MGNRPHRRDRPMLTIAVPTFERSRSLVDTIESIRRACGQCVAPVEVLVVDNASGDDSREVVARSARDFLGLRYERQDSNVGGERNFFSCIEMALGSHVWVVGDDDVVEPSSVARIVRALDEGADAVVLNYSVWSSDLRTCLKPVFFKVPDDRVFESADAVLETFGGGLGFTGAVVIDRARVVRHGHELFLRHAGVGLCFLDCVYRSLVGARAFYVAAPLTRNRGDNSRDLSGVVQGWSSEHWNRVFVAGFQLVLSGFAEYGYSRRAVRRARDLTVRLYVPERLRRLRRARQPYRETVMCLLHCAYDLPSVWTHALPMLLVPRSILRITPRLRRFFQRRAVLANDSAA